MKLKKIFKNDKAVAGAIEFLLLIAFFAFILSYMQLKHVPEAVEDKEAAHMETISNQLSRLKALVDIQSQQNSSKPLYNVLTLGSRELPYLFSLPAYGEIIIINEGGTDSYLSVENDIENITYSLSCIKYDANNYEFVDQTYVLEGGGIIVKQSGENSVMMVDPNLNATFDQDTETIIFHFDMPVFLNKGVDDNIVGIENCFVRTNYSSKMSDKNWKKIDNFNYLNISTNYRNAWYNFLDTNFNKRIRENISISKTSYGISLFSKSNSDLDLDLFHKKSCFFVSVE